MFDHRPSDHLRPLAAIVISLGAGPSGAPGWHLRPGRFVKIPRRCVVIQLIGFVGKNYRKIPCFMGKSHVSWENPICHGKIDGFRFRCSLTSTHFLLWINIEDPKDREWSKVSHTMWENQKML